jgi:1-pyrroline-5-carboxylate dehydrogenase
MIFDTKMATKSSPSITYTTATPQSDDFHASFERAGEGVFRELGASVPAIVAGVEERGAPAVRDVYPVEIDLLVAEVPESGAALVDRAVRAAQESLTAWERLGWQERARILLEAADLIDANRFRLAAIATYETGKVRLEAVGEVDEAAELIRYYARCFEAANGFELELGNEAERAWSTLRPWGVWAVISPFNFPLALPAGMSSAILLGGNTIILKPAPETAVSALAFVRLLHDAGVPPGVLNLVHGDAETGSALVDHPDLDGLAFTGSREVGMAIARSFGAKRPRPFVCELGGKNPVIVMETADVAKAVEGTARSAFGLTGQKCSAASRAYVHEAVYDEFVEGLAAHAAGLTVGDPFERSTFTGPLATQAAFDRYRTVAERARSEGRVRTGAATYDDERSRGWFAAPTVVDGIPKEHDFLREELFLPFVAVAPIMCLDEAIAEANAVPYGLTAGIFSEDEDDVHRFMDGIEAGVVYANRAAGATTGAWPGVQSFGGWKESGLSGRHALGPHYVQQFMREQSRTLPR